MPRRLLTLTSILVLAACPEHAPAYYGITDEAPATSMTTAVSFPEPSEPTSTHAPDDPATTSTSTAASSTGSDLAGEPENAGPQIYSIYNWASCDTPQ